MNSKMIIDLNKLLENQELLNESPIVRDKNLSYCGYNIKLVKNVDVFDRLPKPLAGKVFNDNFVVTDDHIKQGFCSYNFVCLDKTTNTKILMKLSYLSDKSFENEYKIHKDIINTGCSYNNCPNIIFRLEATYGDYKLKGYAMEYIEDSKTYNDFLSEIKTEEEKKTILGHIREDLYRHLNNLRVKIPGFCHNDIKSDNVLIKIDKEYNDILVYLIDFSSSYIGDVTKMAKIHVTSSEYTVDATDFEAAEKMFNNTT
jgi:serine/threonine protein kinase